MPTCPQIILRYGAHAEKEYLLKLFPRLDGLHINANLVEMSQYASASLVAVNRSKHPEVDLYLNPVTYLFGPYIGSEGKSQRSLDWIKSYSKKRGGYGIKDSYNTLANEMGRLFSQAVETETAIDFLSLSPEQMTELCSDVLRYQRTRLASIIDSDGMAEFADLVSDESCGPTALFSPYFLIANEWLQDGIDSTLAIASESVEIAGSDPVHQLFLLPPEVLDDYAALRSIVDGVTSLALSGVWLWISGFNELTEPRHRLSRLRALVRELSGITDVHLYAGGLWSLLLGRDGLKSVAHGVGYGEGRDALSPIGAAAPTVRYYLPPLGKRVSVANIERSFLDMEIHTAEEFFEEVCGCSICRGVIGDELKRFSAFGEVHRATGAGRTTQTPVAAKLCRFHFLLHRLLFDRDFVTNAVAGNCVNELELRVGEWSSTPALRGESSHIREWIESLSDAEPSLESTF